LTVRDGSYYLSPRRNELRLPSYQRIDIRANKSFTYDAWKLTLYGEVINVTNRENIRFLSFDGVNGTTQRAFVTTDRVFPIVPVAGVTLEF
jgi:outer membrane receptor protein involved in Fe transport